MPESALRNEKVRVRISLAHPIGGDQLFSREAQQCIRQANAQGGVGSPTIAIVQSDSDDWYRLPLFSVDSESCYDSYVVPKLCLLDFRKPK